MAGTERRRFLTRHDIEDAAAAGRAIQVRGRDVLTDEAAQRARDLGVRIERDGDGGSGARASGAGASGSSASGSSASGVGAPVSREDLRRAVRAAVVAELRTEPPGLDAVIDRVLQRRGQ
jgi:hypothetical protein